MELRIIKTDEQHRRYLEEARRLAKGDPEPGSNDCQRIPSAQAQQQADSMSPAPRAVA